jgi:AraC-like DNA-binding protein
VREVTPIAAGDGFSLEHVVVRADDERWSEPELPPGHRLVFVRRGAFRARVGGHRLLADPAVAYAGGPAEEQSIAHRVRSEDTCTAIVMSPDFVAALTGGTPLRPYAPVSGEVAVAHRVLAARAARAEPFELAELTVRLVGGLTAWPPAGAGRPGTEAAHRELADAARELLAAEPAGLREIARRLGCSPYHLSRVFHRRTGLTLTRYRNRLRVMRALEAIEAGETDLAGLAVRLGFADHAHLTRTVRRECGRTPRGLRRLLAN